MVVDLGNLQLGLSIGGLAQLDALEARLAALSAQSQTAKIGVDTSAVGAANQEIAALGTAHQALGNNKPALTMDVTQLEAARSSVQGMQGDILSLAGTIQNATPILAFAAAAGGVAVFAASYQTLLVQVANQTSLTTAEIGTMDKTIRDLPSGNASLQDLAMGFKNITDLGYGAADAVKIATEESKAATATGASQATTMLAVTSAMKEYNATADQTGKYTNIIAEASRLGNTTLDQWTEGTRRATAIAAAYGVPLQEVDAALVALTRHGFDASESSTQLSGIIQHIVNPTAAARKEIELLSQSTGVDLAADFSDTGLKARGLDQILTDLTTVVQRTGDEGVIAKLIPALRGGQGALLLATQASGDFQDALGKLGATADGSLTPVEDGFARIQQTAGYQWGQFVKGIKLDAIDLGNAFLPIARAFEAIPAPVIKAGMELLLFGAAIKSVSALADLVETGAIKIVSALAGETTATIADTAAVTANTAALDANATARGVSNASQLTALKAPLAEGEQLAPTVLAGSAAATEQIAMDAEVVVRQVDTTAAKATIAETVGALGSTMTAIAIPVAAAFAVGEFIVGPWQDAVAKKAAELQQQKIEMTVQTTVRFAQSADSREQGRADLQAQLVDAQAMQKQFEDLYAKGLNNQQVKDAVDYFKGVTAEISKALADTSSQHYASAATDEFTAHLKDLADSVDHSRLSMTEATTFAKEYGDEAVGLGANVTTVQDAIENWTTTLGKNAQAQHDAARAADEHAQSLYDQRNAALAVGATTEDISRAVYGQTGSGSEATAQQVAAAKKDIADLTAAQRQADADAVAAAKAQATEIANTNKAAAQAVETAWKNAETEVGKVDISKGLIGLSASADGLDKIKSVLDGMGQTSPALSALTAIADEFSAITKSENDAATAFNGFMLPFNETDNAIKQLEALKKRYDDLADAAATRLAAGTGLSNDAQLVAGRSAFDANTQAEINNLTNRQGGDLVAAVKVVPDFSQFDQQKRDKLQQEGGGQALILKIDADKTGADQQIKDMEAAAHATTLKVELDAKDAMAQIDQMARDRTLTVHVKTDGATGALSDTMGAYGSGTASNPAYGNAPPPPPGGAFSYADYAKVVGDSPISGQQNYDTLLQVANSIGVDARQLLAVMQTESDFGRTADKLLPFFNFGGMGVNDRGNSFDSGIHATDGGPEYAGYADLKSFLTDLGQWIKANNGDFSNYQTQDQGQGKGNAYAQLQQQLPSSADASGKVWPGSYGQGGSDEAAQVNSIRQQIVAKALQSVNTDHLANLCEQFVEETVQAITGVRGATGQRELTANAGLADAAAKGLEVTQAQAKPGDLVYYGDAAAGHVAIYMGGGQQISTADHNEQGQNAVVHVEAVGPGAVFINSLGGSDKNLTSAPVKVPIVEQISQSGDKTANVSNVLGAAGTTNLADPNTDAAKQALAQQAVGVQALKTSVADLRVAQSAVNAAFANLDPKNIVEANKEYSTLLPLMTKAEQAKLPDTADANQKLAATNEAEAKALNLTALWGQGLQEISSRSGNIADVQNRLVGVGGDIAKNLSTQLGLMSQIADSNERVATIQGEIKQLDADHAAVVQQRAVADAADAAQQQQIQRQQQDAATARQRQQTLDQRAIQDQHTAESQMYQDQTTAIQRQQAQQQQAWSDAAQAISRAHAVEQQAFSDNETAISRQHAALQQQWADEAQAVSRAHAVEQQAFADNEQAIQRQQAAQQMAWRNEDQATQWQATLDARAARDKQQAIADEHTALQQMWADQATADAAAKTARDAAWQTQQWQTADQRQALVDQQTKQDQALQDQITNLQHYGTLQNQQLQAQLVAAQTQAGAVTATNSGQEQLLGAQVQGSSTNAEAQNYAEQLAALKDQDAQAQKALTDQTATIQKAIDAEAKLAAEQLFALQQQQTAQTRNNASALEAFDQQATAADRAHTLEEQAIAQEIAARNNQHQQLMTQWQAEAAAQAKIAQAQADAAQNQQHEIMLTRQAITDAWAADTQARQDQQQALTRLWASQAQAIADQQQAETRLWATEAQNRSDTQQALTRQWAAEAQNISDAQQAETRRWAAEGQSRDDAHNAFLRNQAAEDLARSRAFEDQSFQIQQTQLAEQRRHEDARAQIAATRTADDNRYNAEKTDLGNQLTAEQANGTELKNQLTTTQQLLSQYDGINARMGTIGSQLANAATLAASASAAASQAAYNLATANLATSNNVPFNQFPAPRQFATGGSVSGLGIVGDSPSGDMSSAEAVIGNYTVIPHDQSAAMGLLGGQRSTSNAPLANTAPYKAGAPTPQNVTVNKGGNTFNFTIHAQPGQDAKAIAAQIKAMIEQHDRDTSTTAYAAASGLARS